MASGDIILAPGEQGLYTRAFRPNLVLFWLRTTMTVTNKRLVVKFPNTVLGVIPLGFEERSMPMGAIAGLTTSLRVRLGRLIVGAVLGIVCLVWLFSAVSAGSVFMVLVSLVLTLLFFAMACNAVTSALIMQNNGGNSTETTVSFLENTQLDSFKNKVNEFVYSASAGGTSWEMQYGTNSEGFQNRLGQAGPYGHGQPAPGQQQQFRQPGQGHGQFGQPGQQQFGQPGEGHGHGQGQDRQ